MVLEKRVLEHLSILSPAADTELDVVVGIETGIEAGNCMGRSVELE